MVSPAHHERHSRRPEHRLQAAARFLRTNTTRATDEELANNAATKRQTPEVHMEEESAPGGHEAARIESRWAEMLTQLNNITAPAAIIPRETLPKALSRLDAIEEEAGFNPDDSAGLPINDENLSQPLDDAGKDEWEDIDNDEHEHKHKHKHEPTNSDPAGKGDWYPFKNKLVIHVQCCHERCTIRYVKYSPYATYASRVGPRFGRPGYKSGNSYRPLSRN
ncbi:hypothetical protein MJO29_010836 [Puccinia striiformis f. sp. tritici]|nr:hypothetical protein MJO29_010836 [Puccinia striiformis f. sp. tritici]